DAPGVAGAFHAAEGGLQLGRELPLHHDQVAADVDDVDHLLAADRADLHAGAARGAGPDGLRGDGELDEGARALLASGEGVAYEVEFVTLVDLHGRRAQGLARLVGRADVGAAVALDAGVGVEDLRVGEVLETRGPELLG